MNNVNLKYSIYTHNKLYHILSLNFSFNSYKYDKKVTQVKLQS